MYVETGRLGNGLNCSRSHHMESGRFEFKDKERRGLVSTEDSNTTPCPSGY